MNPDSLDGPLTPSLSPSEGERVPFRAGEGFRGSKREQPAQKTLSLTEAETASAFDLARRVRAHLFDHILPFWCGPAVDNEQGGWMAWLTNDLQPDRTQPRGSFSTAGFCGRSPRPTRRNRILCTGRWRSARLNM